MSEKRRDHRGRILHNGEMQLSDGRYRFKYVDEITQRLPPRRSSAAQSGWHHHNRI